MALRAGYYGIKRFLRDKLETIARTYAETIKSLFPRSEQAVLGAGNFLPNDAVSGEFKGITCVRNYDGSITTTGTNTSSDDVIQEIASGFTIPKGSYILSGCPAGGGTDYELLIYYTQNGSDVVFRDYGSGKAFTLDEDTTFVKARMIIRRTKTVSNITWKPMISLSADTSYAPYAMTNKKLTDSAAEQKTAINAIITAATDAADFAAFKTAMGSITPVTRSLSFAKEDITEEVKEDVEPEKTVTKKRTTKKTEEV